MILGWIALLHNLVFYAVLVLSKAVLVLVIVSLISIGDSYS